jgi:hypothetical protein
MGLSSFAATAKGRWVSTNTTVSRHLAVFLRNDYDFRWVYAYREHRCDPTLVELQPIQMEPSPPGVGIAAQFEPLRFAYRGFLEPIGIAIPARRSILEPTSNLRRFECGLDAHIATSFGLSTISPSPAISKL